MDIKEIFSKNLRKYRKDKKISQTEICKKLDLIGVTMYICDIYEIEYGKKTVKDYEALAFCKVLGITLDDLYSNTEEYYEAWNILDFIIYYFLFYNLFRFLILD